MLYTIHSGGGIGPFLLLPAVPRSSSSYKTSLFWKHTSSLSKGSGPSHLSSLLRSYPVLSFKSVLAPDLSSKCHLTHPPAFLGVLCAWLTGISSSNQVLLSLSRPSHPNLLLHHFFLILTNDINIHLDMQRYDS